jgi:thiaminase
MTQFSEAAWQCTTQLRHAIDELPFNIELAAGRLSRDRFQGYIVQDALKHCAPSAHVRWKPSPSSRRCTSAT